MRPADPGPLTSRAGRRGARTLLTPGAARHGTAQGGRQAGAAPAAANPNSSLRSASPAPDKMAAGQLRARPRPRPPNHAPEPAPAAPTRLSALLPPLHFPLGHAHRLPRRRVTPAANSASPPTPRPPPGPAPAGPTWRGESGPGVPPWGWPVGVFNGCTTDTAKFWHSCQISLAGTWLRMLLQPGHRLLPPHGERAPTSVATPSPQHSWGLG